MWESDSFNVLVAYRVFWVLVLRAPVAAFPVLGLCIFLWLATSLVVGSFLNIFVWLLVYYGFILLVLPAVLYLVYRLYKG